LFKIFDFIKESLLKRWLKQKTQNLTKLSRKMMFHEKKSLLFLRTTSFLKRNDSCKNLIFLSVFFGGVFIAKP
jgi:hypothetical protein